MSDELKSDPSAALEAFAHSVIVVAEGDTARAAAVDLARMLRLPFCDIAPESVALRLVQSETDLCLRDSVTGARLRVEFTAARLQRYRAGGAGGDPLRRAIGPDKRHVVDATAGFGGDAVHLAALGHRVTAIERNVVVGALVRDGLQRARAQGLLEVANPRWLTGDACALLPQLDSAPATVYLDPMFPPKRKRSAAVRKEMNLLRRLAIDDTGAIGLLRVARAYATDRVVVKRPIGAPALAAGVIAAYCGKLVRYDVYRPQGARV